MRYDVSFDIIGRGGNGWGAGVLLFFLLDGLAGCMCYF
jgi:hypothetical protein